MKLTERKHKACAINLDGRKVLTYNLDKKSIYAGSAVVKIGRSKNPRHDGLRYNMMLGRGYNTELDGIFYLDNCSTVISADDHWSKYIKFAEESNAPVAEPGDKFAILVYSPSTGATEVHTVTLLPDWTFEEDSEEETMMRINHILHR